MNHRVGRVVFTTLVGLIVATLSYKWITNPDGREQRAEQIAVVESSRDVLTSVLPGAAIEIVDPLDPNRKVGKVYVYPDDSGWQVSGYYRRGEGDRWHPYLMQLDSNRELTLLKVQDSEEHLAERASADPRLEISP